MALNRLSLFAYGFFGLPLALVALPIYVYVPQFYAEHFGMSLAAIGSTLLAARLFDAFIDPAFGLWIDRRRARRGYPYFILLALAPLAIGFVALFAPPTAVQAKPLLWFLASLVLVYVGFSLATIAHQSWGAALSQVRGERARITGTREACGLVGVLIAAALPSVAGIGALSAVFVAALLLGAALLLWRAPRPGVVGPDTAVERTCMPAQQGAGAISITEIRTISMDEACTGSADALTPTAVGAAPAHAASSLRALAVPFRDARFRWLFAVFVCNGIAAAIPATLFLFFAKDRLQLGQYAGLFLVLYFAAAAFSLPLWVALARRRGEAWAWLASMLLAVAAFVWVYSLGPGAAIGFGVISAMSGIALGADLALPPALLAAVIARAGHSGRREGAYFGAWSWATKMNLALAAGVALPLLQRLGYVPGTVDAHGMQALRIGYAVLPCGLKLLAAALLWRAPLKDI